MLHVKAKASPGTPGVLSVALPVTFAATAATAAASARLATEGLSQSSLAGLLALFAAATLIEAVPLPIGGIPIGKTSLASVFVVATAVLYGWAAVTVMAVLMQLAVEAGSRRPLRVAYNCSVYALAAAAAGAAAAGARTSALDHVLVEVGVAAAAFYAVDLGLVTLVVARADQAPFLSLLRRTLASTVVPLTVMASLSVILVILWEESPFLAAALFGPVIAFDLYQRSQLRTLEEMEAAVTDPFMPIGDRRRLEALAPAAAGPSLQAVAPAVESAADRATRLEAAANLARAVDSSDLGGRRHSESVGRLAALVAAQLGLDSGQCELLGVAGRLHDLGKAAIPDEILQKPGRLDPDERRVVERHPAVGANMLVSLGLSNLAPWVLHHHERWDGQGYPQGLSGEEIPLASRIIFVVDAYDAMTSDLVYRARRSAEQAMVELERCAGTQFDEAVVAALLTELQS